MLPPTFWREPLLRLSWRIRRKLKTGKLASRWVSSLASWIAGTYFKQAEASLEVKVKLNESRRLKFYQVKPLKENSTENSAENKFKEVSHFKHFNKTKKKRKIHKFKELCFPDTLSDKSRQITLKSATRYLFHLFLSNFFCIKFLFKIFIVCVIFSNQYPNYKPAELTVWTYRSILHTKILTS